MKTSISTIQTRRAQGAIIMTPAQYKTYRPPLPDSLFSSIGMFKHHKKGLIKHLKTIRKEWDE